MSFFKTFKDKLTEEDIIKLILHVGDHAGCQGHIRGTPYEEYGCCKDCEKLMAKLFPGCGWDDEE